MKNIIFLVLISIFLSCSNQDNKSKLLGKELFFSDSLFYIKNGDIKKFDIGKNNHVYKIIVPLSGECPKCLKAINNIQLILKKLKKEYDIESFYMMDISDTSLFKNAVYQLLPPNNYILNLDYLFHRQNKLNVPEIRYRGIIINENNSIIYDSFLLDEYKDVNAYLKKINGILTKQK